nr:hypothetical protein BaRGS_001379 [Batillaria attramentaria]
MRVVEPSSGNPAHSLTLKPTSRVYVIKVTDVYVANPRVWDILVEICFNVFVPVTSLVVVIAANVVIAVRMRSVLAWRKDAAHVGIDDQTTGVLEVSTVYEDTFDGIITEETLRLIETVVNAVILPVLVLFGFAGNITNMVVFVRQGLAISDTGFLLSHMASRSFAILDLIDMKLGDYWRARTFFWSGVYLGFLLTSDSITLVIAVQRCIIVVSPLRAKRMPGAK